MGINFAQKCAWRAMYVSVGGRQVFYIGVDPMNGVNPVLFGGVLRKGFRVRLPAVKWKSTGGAVWLFFYKLSSKFWLAVDGRYSSRSGV